MPMGRMKILPVRVGSRVYLLLDDPPVPLDPQRRLVDIADQEIADRSAERRLLDLHPLLRN